MAALVVVGGTCSELQWFAALACLVFGEVCTGFQGRCKSVGLEEYTEKIL